MHAQLPCHLQVEPSVTLRAGAYGKVAAVQPRGPEGVVGWYASQRTTPHPKGAQTHSCGSPVLMEQATKQVSSTYDALAVLGDDGQSVVGSGACSVSDRWGRWPL